MRHQLDPADAERLLRYGEVELEGRLAEASNITLRVILTLDGVCASAVYKPTRGERPLWDFRQGTLAGREVAAYLVSQATGWGIVPPTVLREGPLGPGACQLWVDQAAEATELVGFVRPRRLPDGWLRVGAARDNAGNRYLLAHADDPRLARMAIFDAVVNNADRKGGHVISGAGGRVYGVDHGVCFHVEDKLRTVLWGWAGSPLPAEITPVLAELAGELRGALGRALSAHLARAEVSATVDRLERLLVTGRYPLPSDDWPAMPWPPL